MSAPYKYFAFISYSRKDSKAAAWLQKRLEWFRFPVKLVPEERRPPNSRYIRPIYRDKTNLPVTVESYWKDIRLALEESRFLIVLCSPHSAASQPVDMEVSHFLATHNDDASQLVPIIVSGNVASSGEDAAFCPTLRSLGESLIERTLPTMLPDGDKDELDAWEQGFVSLASYLLSLDRAAIGDHIQRETKRQAKVLRRWLAAVVVLTLCAIAGVFYSLIQKREAESQRNKAEQLLWTASYGDHEAALLSFKDNRHSEGLAYFERSLRYMPRNRGAFAASASHALGIDTALWRTRSISAFSGGVIDIAFSPDGHRFAAVSFDKTARVIEVKTGEEVCTVEFGDSVTSVGFSPDGRYFAAGSWDKSLRVIEATTGKQVSRADFAGSVISISFSPDGQHIVAGSSNRTGPGTARVVVTATGEEVSSIRLGHSVYGTSFSTDGRYVAAGNLLFEAATGKEIKKLLFGATAYSVRFSPNGRHLAAGGDGGALHLVDAETGELVWKAYISGTIWSLDFSPDGLYLVTGDDNKTVHVLEAATGKEVFKTEFGGSVRSVCFSPDGRHVAVGSDDKTARVIEVPMGNEVCKVEFAGGVDSVKFSPDGCYLVAGSKDKTARVIEASAGKEISNTDFAHDVKSLSFSSDGRYLAGGAAQTARVIEVVTGKVVCESKFGNTVNSVSISPDGRYIAVGSNDATANVIEVATGRKVCKVSFETQVESVCFSPDGRYFAAGSMDNTAKVIEAATGKEICLINFGGGVTSVAFSPNGRYIAAASGLNSESTVRVINAATGREICKVGFDLHVSSMCFSLDSRYLVAGSWDKTARVTEVTTGDAISKVEFDDGVEAVAFSPNGLHFAAGSGDSTVRIFETKTGKELIRAEFGGKVTSVIFDFDGRYLAAGSEDNTVRVIESSTGKEVSHVLFASTVASLAFSHDGRFLAVGSLDETLRVVDCSWHNSGQIPTASWVGTLKIQAGMKFQSDGRLAPISVADLITAQQEIEHFIQSQPATGTEWEHAVLNWAAQTPETRSTSPWTNEPIRIAGGRWLMQAGSRNESKFRFDASPIIKEAANQVPWHPLEPLSLARLEPKPDEATDSATRETMSVRPRFLARLTLKRLREADENIYGRDTLAEYAAWAAKVIHEEIPNKNDIESRKLFAKKMAQSIASLLNAAVAAGVDTDGWKTSPDDLANLARVGVTPTIGAFAGKTFRLSAPDDFVLDDSQNKDVAVYLSWDKINRTVVYSGENADDAHFFAPDVEAIEAVTFALERTPPEKQKDLLELKGKIEAK